MMVIKLVNTNDKILGRLIGDMYSNSSMLVLSNLFYDMSLNIEYNDKAVILRLNISLKVQDASMVVTDKKSKRMMESTK